MASNYEKMSHLNANKTAWNAIFHLWNFLKKNKNVYHQPGLEITGEKVSWSIFLIINHKVIIGKAH